MFGKFELEDESLDLSGVGDKYIVHGADSDFILDYSHER